MAIIKCPECNQEISDKAPVCPSCGVPIAGHVVTCPQCGYTYFNNNTECPHCHHKTGVESAAGSVQLAESENEQKTSRSNNNKTVIAVVVLIVLVLGVVLYAFYRNAQCVWALTSASSTRILSHTRSMAMRLFPSVTGIDMSSTATSLHRWNQQD